MRRILAVLAFLSAAFLTLAAQPATAAPCPNTDELFASAPFDLNGVAGIIPLGRLTPEGHHMIPTRHIYVDPAFAVLNDPTTVKAFRVFAPASLELVVAEKYANHWSLYMKRCDKVTLYYFHVETLAPELKQQIAKSAAGTLDFGESQAMSVSVPLVAGQLLGWTKQSLNVGVHDFRKAPQPFVNPARYAVDFKSLLSGPPFASNPALAAKIAPHAVPQALYNRCALDYFTAPLRDQMQKKLADGQTKAVGSPPCHSHMLDVPNTAQGNWWADRDPKHDALFSEDFAIALANWNLKPAVQLFSLNTTNTGLKPEYLGMSGSLGKIRTVFEFPVSNSSRNRPFAQIADSNLYCYESLTLLGTVQKLNAVILIQVTDSVLGARTALNFEIVAQPNCASLPKPWTFSSAKKTFYR